VLAAERRWRAMGTACHVVVVVDDDEAGTAALADAVTAVEALEDRWSRFRAGSDVCRVNAAAGEPVAVAPVTLDAVAAALDARDRTAGRFDPTVLGALVAAGYDRSFADLPAARTPLATAPRRAAGAAVRIDRRALTVAVERGAGLDLGGIGKGLAADLVVASLVGRPGVAGACVNLGGDLRVVGAAPPPEPAGWGVALDGGAVLAVADGGVATSTTAKRTWTGAGGERLHHVIDPATGRPALSPVETATVVAATAAEAEVLATSALLAPDTVDDATPALLTAADGTTRSTPALEDYLR